MKRDLQKMIAFVAILLLPFALFSQEYGRVLTEGFEDGIPQEWLQEKVSGDISWTVENGGVRPNGAFDGDKRLIFRNTSGKTTKAKTRLVLPLMDISKVYQPILVFAHAQDKWTDDFDTLKILYRTSADANWTELKVYDKYIAKWTVDTVRLIAANKTYQIAFEATDNLGRGIALDNIEIRSTPNCLTPYDLNVSNISNDSATIGWLGSFDAESFSVKVSTVALTAEQLADETFKADIVDTVLSDVWSFELKKLVQNVTYYYYIKSNCEGEDSEWATSSFKTANFVQLPYKEEFDSEATPGFVTYPTGWYGDGTTTKPYVNSGNTNDKFYTSVDGTYILCFNGSNSNAGSSDIPGGSFSYAVMPQIDLPSLSVLQVSFWTIRYYPNNSERFSIIVGVMTDPTVKGSFVPVDTVNITTLKDYVECIVSLENYKGDGKYIAFMSDFAESNIFLMDKLKVDYRPEIQKVTFDLGLPTATSVSLDFDQNYEKYDVVVANEKKTVAQLDSAIDVIRAEIVDKGVVEGLAHSSEIYVYARAIKGTEKGEWSNAVRVRTPGKVEAYPYTVDFELNQNDPTTFYHAQQGMYINTAGRLVPEIIYLTEYTSNAACINTYWTSTSTVVKARTPYELYMLASIDNDSWMTVVMPEMLDVNGTRVSFYATNHSASYGSTFYVGIMSDANDASTFVPVDTVTVGLGYEYLEYEFDKFTGKGKFLAFKIDKAHYVDEYSNNIFIDDVKYESIPTCRFPSKPQVTSNPTDPSKVTLTWEANGVTQWNVRLSEVEYDRDSFYVDSLNYQYIYNGTVSTNSVEFTGLKFPNVKYYYWLQPVCDGVAGQWTVAYSFNSECYGIQPLPYFEDFDNEAYTTSTTERDFTVPCMYTTRIAYTYSGGGGGSTTYYPYLSTSKAVTGKALYLTKSSSWYPAGINTYVALPKMAAPVKDLQLSFKMYAADAKYTVSVGVMEDPLDSANTEIVSVIKPKILNEFVEYIVTFENYTGKGEYIAITTNDLYTNPYVYIDDIKVDYKAKCARPEELSLLDVTNSSANIGWAKSSATQWRVMITSDRLTNEQLQNVVLNDTIVKIDTVTTNPATISGLEDNTAYFAYVQAICSAEDVSAWSNPLPFRTSCVILNVGELGVENFDTYGTGNNKFPPCYIVGNKSNPSSAGYIPQCNASYHHSGGASLKIYSTTTYNGAYAITSRLDISDISMLRVKFWGSTGTEANAKDDKAHALVVGVVTDPTDLATFVAVDTLNFAYEGRPYEVYLNTYESDFDGNKGKYVMFYSEFDKTNTVFIDDLEFDTIPSCVTRIDVENITHNSASVKFVSDSIISSNAPYQLKYATALCTVKELNKDSLPVINVATGNKVTITGLEPNTNYYLYARSTCGDGYSEWSNVEVVTTSCLELWSLPFFADFEDQKATSGQPTCWNVHSGSTSYPGINTTHYNSGKKGIYLYCTSSYNSYLVTQEIDVDNLAKCQVSFFMKAGTAAKDRSVIVGVVSNLDSIKETFVAVDTIILNQATIAYEQQLVLLDSYVGTGKYVAFYSDYVLNGKATGTYIDDITIELIPTCAKPFDFSLVDLTDNTITISYNHESATNFELKYSTKDFDPTVEGTSLEVTGKVATISNLTAQTEYYIYARACCSATEKSPWQKVGVYSTISKPYSEFPYSFGFEDAIEATNWQFAQDEQPNQWYIGADTAYAVTDFVNNGGKALYISKDGGLSAQYREAKDADGNAATSYSWAYRPMILKPGVYTVSYDWTCYGEGTADYVRAGLLPVTSTFRAGSNVVYAKDGSSVSMTYTTATQPKGWLELSEEYTTGSYKLNLVDTTLAFAEQWESINEVLFIDDETAGTYYLVFYWRNDASVGKYAAKRSAVIDNIHIKQESCIQPINVNVVDYSSSTADITWASYLCTPKAYEYVVTTEAGILPGALTKEQESVHNVVDTTAIHIDSLAENTTYYFYVRSICAEGDTSFWADAVSFKTVCNPQPTDTIYNMDSEEGYYLPTYVTGTTKNTTYKVPNCFINSHESMDYTSSNVAYFPYLIKNTSTAKYARSGEYALRFYRANNTTNPGGIIALPMVDGDMEELQVNFWMRCVHNNATGKLTVTGINSTYNRKVTVGTMTDPYDASTFEPLGVFEYPYKNGDLTTSNNISQDESGNDYWVECNMPLAGAKGKYIAFKNEGYEDATGYNLVYVDDISVTSLSCTTPGAIVFDSITSNSVVVDAVVSEAEKYVVQIATNEEFTNARMDTVVSLPATIGNLADATEYYVKLQSLCSAEDVSKWSFPVSFTTLTTLPYNQVFSNASYRPSDWSQASSPKLDDYMSGTTTTFSMMLPTGSGGWSTEAAMFDEGMFSTRHVSVLVNSTNKYWLFTPIFEMPESEKTHLVFDLALTSQNSNLPITEEDRLMEDDRFVIIVSEDGGKTWNRSNMTVWAHDYTANYKFFDIPHTGKQYDVDLSKYAGKTIQVAFYVESTVSTNGAKIELHLDNVHFNAYKEEVVNMSICQTEDFDYEPFFISSADLEVGENNFSYLEVANKVADTNYKLNLVVTPMVETKIEATICEGDVYAQNNFSQLTEPGIYKQKLPSACGCDSVVILDLSVTKSENVMMFDTICYGNSVIWNGVEYNRTGVAIDTLVSKVTGCDSIVTFVLTVKDAIRTEAYQNICFGGSYQFGTQTITATGDYTETFQTATGCDSIVTLHATVLPDYRTTLNVTIFEGETYSENGFIGLKEAGTYTLPLKSKVGDCDSTITLNLKVIDPTEVAIGNVNSVDLTLVPNPVESGNTLFVNAEFTKEQTEGLLVEVFNAVGQKVYSDEPSVYPIEINGLTQRGVYLVRITAGNGKVYQGKVVVK